MKLLLVGAGKWGQKYISALSKYDVKLEVANRDNWKQLIDNKPDGVMICTPPSSHIEIAEFALQRNIPTMIEKPLSLSWEEAYKLKKYDHVPILVNHIHLFSETYGLLKYHVGERIDKIVSLGFNSGPVRDYSSLWDYGPHDISMILDLVEPISWFPDQVNATEIKTRNGSLFDIKMKFGNIETESLIGNGGSHPVRRLKVESGGLQIVYDGKLPQKERFTPLENALLVFIRAIHGAGDDRLGLDFSFRVLKVLESCEKSLTLHHY